LGHLLALMGVVLWGVRPPPPGGGGGGGWLIFVPWCLTKVEGGGSWGLVCEETISGLLHLHGLDHFWTLSNVVLASLRSMVKRL